VYVQWSFIMVRTIPLSRLRNFGIIAHVDAGKTTLTEKLLLATGRIHRAGGVDEGTTTTDFDPDERKKGITIGAAAVSCPWRDHALTLIDTPGHADFTLEVERALRVLDGAIVVIDGVAGVEPQTETVWRQADRHGVPRIVLVNKLDRAGADFDRSLASVRALGVNAVAIARPIGAEETFSGVEDLVRDRDRALIEATAEIDDELLERFASGAEITSDELLAAIRRGVRGGRIVPVLAGSAMRGIGVESVLDAIVDLLPAPDEAPALADAVTHQTRERSREAPLAALCFKVSFDSFGALAFVRVYAGVLAKGASVRAGKRSFRVGRLVRLFGARREDVAELAAGEIGAIIGADLATGDTLCDPDAPMLLEPVLVPLSILRVAIEPVTRNDRDKLGEALRRLVTADPSLVSAADPETDQILLAGMGELHLEIAVGKLAREHGVEVRTGAPKVAYRETITRAARVRFKLEKQTGGPGMFAVVDLEVAPSPGTGFVFEDRVRGGAIPKAFIPGVERGCSLAMQRGVLGGYPAVDVHVTLHDGDFHSHDSSELAFEIAAQHAFKDACREAAPALLEPWMRLSVRAPTDRVGDIVGDLSARRAKILAIDADPTGSVVSAEAPLAQLFRYATDLGSLTRGRGAHTMTFARYAQVPDALVGRALERG
jgi:elongation factor G